MTTSKSHQKTGAYQAPVIRLILLKRHLNHLITMISHSSNTSARLRKPRIRFAMCCNPHGNFLSIFLAIVFSATGCAAPPRDSLPLTAPEWPLNYRLHVEFAEVGESKVYLRDEVIVTLSKALDHDIAVENPIKGAPVLRVWSGGKLVRGPEEITTLVRNGAQDFPKAKLDLGADFIGH